MHGSAVSQITDESNGQPVYGPQFFPDRVKVQKCLGRMFLGPRARVDDGNGGELRGHTGGSFQRMSDHQHIRILLSHPDCVCEILAFLHGGTLGFCESESCPTKPCNGRLEAQPGPSARLEEQRSHYSSMKHVGPFLGERLHDFSHVQNVVNLFSRKVAY